jgi:SAM-dependent methyltransferase
MSMSDHLPTPLQRLARHLRKPGSLPGLIWKNITFPFTPQGAEWRYDRRLGIDTWGYIEPSRLDISEGSQKLSYAYGGTPPGIAKFLIAMVAPRAKGFTFLDIGSGKGRVLLIAARFPFGRVVGFEHSEQLNEVAASNARQFAKHYPDMVPVELVCGDAKRLPLPDGPLVIFLFNPMTREATTEFAASVKASYQRNPRKIICLYYYAGYADEFAKLDIFPVQKLVVPPPDPTDRYRELKFPSMIFETADPS